MGSGFIYVMSNQSMPNMYKIGKTKHSPQFRAKELSSTSVPTAFELEWYGHVVNYSKAELELHSKLSRYRVRNNREFFSADLDVIISAAREISEMYTFNEFISKSAKSKFKIKYERGIKLRELADTGKIERPKSREDKAIEIHNELEKLTDTYSDKMEALNEDDFESEEEFEYNFELLMLEQDCLVNKRRIELLGDDGNELFNNEKRFKNLKTWIEMNYELIKSGASVDDIWKKREVFFSKHGLATWELY